MSGTPGVRSRTPDLPFRSIAKYSGSWETHVPVGFFSAGEKIFGPGEADGRREGVRPSQPYILRIANSTICSTAFASNTMRCSPSMSTTKP